MFGWLKRKGGRPEPPPPGKVFPDIDVDRIAADLRLEREGSKRGEKNQPASDEVKLDVIEQEVVDRVGEFRLMSISNFEEHSQVYADRIARAAGISTDIQTAVGDAETAFMADKNRWGDIISNERNDLRLVNEEFEHFRQENCLNRTVHEGGGLLQWIIVSFIILILESVMNSVFFADAHVLGLVGGVLTAIAFSALNIGGAALTSRTSRNFNHRRLGRKLVGALAFLCGVVFALFFNLFVAHFRNAAEAGKPWGEAAGHAMQRIWLNPLGLESIDAFLLGMLGILAAAVVGWKTYAAGDPYPGYGRVWRKNREAREAYANSKEDVINALTETRDRAVDELRAAISNMEAQFADRITASNELASLRGQLDLFLGQCDRKINLLLTIYRNANKGSRTTPLPEYSSREFHFDTYETGLSPADENPLNKEEIKVLKEGVNRAIDRIYDACKEAIESFKSIDDIESRTPVADPEKIRSSGETGAGSADTVPDHISSLPDSGAGA